MSLQSAAAFALLPSQLESRHFHARVFTCLCLSTGASNHFINGRNLAKKQTHRYTRAHLGHLIRFINAMLTFQNTFSWKKYLLHFLLQLKCSWAQLGKLACQLTLKKKNKQMQHI